LDLWGERKMWVRILVKDAVLIEGYLEALHQKVPGLTYKITILSAWSRCGHVWRTPAMRRSFELYGDVLFLDMMKRKIKSKKWPYVGPVVLNGNKKMEVASDERVLVTEYLDAYDFVVTAMLEVAPNRKKENIKVLCSDGIFHGGGLLQSLWIDDTCFFVAGHYHLQQRDWPDYFRGAWFSLESLFKNYIIYSSSRFQGRGSIQLWHLMAKARPIKLIGYATWKTKYMHTELLVSPAISGLGLLQQSPITSLTTVR
jgi:hypothetical protein